MVFDCINFKFPMLAHKLIQKYRLCPHIDHAEQPLTILSEMVRVLSPGGLIYFTVNIHHPVYEIVSKVHGMWNALGIRIELSPFADHTVHFSEKWIREEFDELPLEILSRSNNIAEKRSQLRKNFSLKPAALMRAAFFKNALFEAIAIKR